MALTLSHFCPELHLLGYVVFAKKVTVSFTNRLELKSVLLFITLCLFVVFAEVKATSIDCPVNITEDVDIYVFRWSETENVWTLIGHYEDYICREGTVSFSIVSGSWYTYVVRGADSHKTYLQVSEPGESEL